MRFVNESDGIVHVAIGKNGIRVEPKAVVDIPDGYAHPRRADNGSRRPSVIEELAPQLQPADAAEKAVWLQAPAARGQSPKATNMPTVEGYVASGVPRGQAEFLVKQAHQAVIDALGRKEDKSQSKGKA
jgi:hypothetical protein